MDRAASSEIGVAACRAVCRLIKGRARGYVRHPAALELLHPGLSSASPAALVATAAHLVERESRSPRRWFGFGGEVGLVNARAALLLGRLERRRLTACREAGGQEPDGRARVCRAPMAKGTGRHDRGP